MIVGGSALAGISFEGGRLSLADFTAGKDEGSTVSAGDVAEVATCEIGEDGQLSSYKAVQLGRPMDPTTKSGKGKLYADGENTSDAEIDGRTEFRIVIRPKNGNSRTPLTDWFPEDELNQSDTEKRIPLPPVTDNQNRPVIGQEGRVLAIEARNPSTSFEFSLSDSRFDIPAKFGY